MKACSDVSKATGESQHLVGLIADSLAQRNIRAVFRQDSKALLFALDMELEFSARAYCGASKTDEKVFTELVEFVLSQFANLALGEIREAFRLAAAGKLGDVNLASYYGLFTVLMLGDVLSAYADYRRRILSELRKVEALSELPDKVWDSGKWAAQRLALFCDIKEPSLDYFTATDYDYFYTQGQLIHSEDEKRQAWDDAKSLTLIDIEIEAQNEQSKYRQKELRQICENVTKSLFAESFTARRAIIAKRLLVLWWVEKSRI